ncbi:hypothetical protein DASC09_024890 [Saccharomycopsis crataegensis]|uniref:Secondary thiamine-phosphate synthase enzyme n=1 Tax=Saccharomycopsis crataegensis TaxID=43959 RepID=A0AAV5QKM2_9ASCO|nr:hypothetical protein DASC09_024890 [Saccharomycopsis crataegensis]
MATVWAQKEFTLSRREKGVYLITNEVLQQINKDLSQVQIGTVNLFVKHTSAGITLNENFDPDVRTDMNNVLDHIVPYNQPYYLHVDEGPDDLPGHIKTSLIGPSVTIPIKNGHLNVGTWQGIYLCEFREYMHSRTIVATITGQKK